MRIIVVLTLKGHSIFSGKLNTMHNGISTRKYTIWNSHRTWWYKKDCKLVQG